MQARPAMEPAFGTGRMKSKLVAYVLWCLCFIGVCGIHRIYTGRVLSGILWLLTFGLLGIGQIIDLFLVPGMVREANLERRVDTLEGRRY